MRLHTRTDPCAADADPGDLHVAQRHAPHRQTMQEHRRLVTQHRPRPELDPDMVGPEDVQSLDAQRDRARRSQRITPTPNTHPPSRPHGRVDLVVVVTRPNRLCTRECRQRASRQLLKTRHSATVATVGDTRSSLPACVDNTASATSVDGFPTWMTSRRDRHRPPPPRLTPAAGVRPRARGGTPVAGDDAAEQGQRAVSAAAASACRDCHPPFAARLTERTELTGSTNARAVLGQGRWWVLARRLQAEG